MTEQQVGRINPQLGEGDRLQLVAQLEARHELAELGGVRTTLAEELDEQRDRRGPAGHELRARARGYSASYMTDRPFGFSYRLKGAAVDHDDPGYHVLISASGVKLMAGAVQVAAWDHPVDAAWHDYRITAVGPHHRVYMDTDDEPILDVVDATYPAAGRVGVAGYYTIASFDHLAARALPVVGTDPYTLPMTMLYWSVEPTDVDDVGPDAINVGQSYLFGDQWATPANAAAAVEAFVSEMAVVGMSVVAGLDAYVDTKNLTPNNDPNDPAVFAARAVHLYAIPTGAP